MTPEQLEAHRVRFEQRYAATFENLRAEEVPPPEEIAADLKGARDGDSYPSFLPGVRNAWQAYQWAIQDAARQHITEFGELQDAEPNGQWLRSGGLLYRLTDGPHPENCDEINVTMVDGSRDDKPRAARAQMLLKQLSIDWKQRAQEAELMAECTTMLRNDLIEAGVIDASVPPMMLTEAILGALQDRPLSHPKSIEAAATMPQYWSVSISVDGSDIVSIGHNWLSGSRPLEERDEQTILGAAQHLLSFIGYGLPPSSFHPYDDAAPVVPAPVAIAWLPIESAPKDMGARLFLVDGYCVQGFMDATGVLNVQSEISPHWRKMRGTPTHWMPLPPAPGAQAAPGVGDEWRELFWSVARALNCLPSTYVDGNTHVYKQAEKYAAIATAAPVAQLSEPTYDMVTAYLDAQRAAVEASDREFGRPNVGGMRTCDVRNACFAGLKAALAAAPTTPKDAP